MTNRSENKALLEKFRKLRRSTSSGETEDVDKAKLAIANVVQAFQGLLSEDKILKAIGNAKSPNGVSRAVRHRLPKLK